MFYYDSTYILVLAALALSLIAQGMVSSAYKKYEKQKNKILEAKLTYVTKPNEEIARKRSRYFIYLLFVLNKRLSTLYSSLLVFNFTAILD